MGPAKLRSVQDNMNGTYTCFFDALSPAQVSYFTASSLMLLVTLNGRQIEGSPFRPAILEDPDTIPVGLYGSQSEVGASSTDVLPPADTRGATSALSQQFQQQSFFGDSTRVNSSLNPQRVKGGSTTTTGAAGVAGATASTRGLNSSGARAATAAEAAVPASASRRGSKTAAPPSTIDRLYPPQPPQSSSAARGVYLVSDTLERPETMNGDEMSTGSQTPSFEPSMTPSRTAKRGPPPTPAGRV